jgi:hypothetical protein
MKPSFRSAVVSLPLLLLFCAQAILAQGSASSNSSVSSARERLSLDRGWLFHEGDIPFPVVIGHQPSYALKPLGFFFVFWRKKTVRC